LSTKHDDEEQLCNEAKKSLTVENDELKRKLDHVRGELNKTVTSKDNDIAMWKVRYEKITIISFFQTFFCSGEI
jgi:regulator of replication initiation timing